MRKYLVMSALLTAISAPALCVADEAVPDATIVLSGGAVAAGVGFVWGDGQLAYKGSMHHVALNGLSVLDVGAAGFTGSGAVYNLHKVEDFSGNYVSVSAGVTVAGGGSAVYLRNQNGVVIKLDSTTQGLRLNLAGGGVGMRITD